MLFQVLDEVHARGRLAFICLGREAEWLKKFLERYVSEPKEENIFIEDTYEGLEHMVPTMLLAKGSVVFLVFMCCQWSF